MQIAEQQHGAVRVVKPDGPLAGEAAGDLKARLLRVQRESLGRVVLDASAVPMVDSGGLEALVDVTDEMARSGGALKLCAVNETLRQVFQVTGLLSRFEYYEDANSAVRSFL
jgi:anti-anti-sigma factor